MNERQQRFLEAFRQRQKIAPAARLSGVHRATVYRWRAEATFAEAMRNAAKVYFQEYGAKVLADEAARRRWRAERARERWSMRGANLALARAAKKRKAEKDVAIQAIAIIDSLQKRDKGEVPNGSE